MAASRVEERTENVSNCVKLSLGFKKKSQESRLKFVGAREEVTFAVHQTRA